MRPTVRPTSLAPRPTAIAAIVAFGAAASIASPLAAQPSDTTSVSTKPLFTRHDAWVAGAFTAATIAMLPLDKVVARRLQDPRAQENRFFRHQATNLRLIGEPGTLFIGAGMYGIGRLAGNERMADLGLHGTEAVLVGLGTTAILKLVIGRARPHVDIENPAQFAPFRGLHDEAWRSFPSGHTTMGFAAAAAVTEETREWWPKYNWAVATAMYGGATLIGTSRMYNNKHWASDVITGAAIGTFAGRKVVRYHHSHPDNRVDRWLLGARVTPGGRVALMVMPTRVRVARRTPVGAISMQPATR